MADFFQGGSITTLHRLTDHPLEVLEDDLLKYAHKRPMGLILPSLFSELEGPALPKILEELKYCDYLSHIIVGLDRADEQQFQYAREFFSVLPQRVHLLWNDGPRLQTLDQELHGLGLSPPEPGKGRNVWLCPGA